MPGRSLQHYRKTEVKVGLYFLLLLGVYAVLLTPNDLSFIHEPAVLIISVALRMVILLTGAGSLFVYLRGFDPRVYEGLLWLLILSALALEFISLVTRPATYLFYIILSFLTVAYAYFLFPAPLALKLGFSAILSAVHIFFIIFAKNFPPASRWTLMLTFLFLNCFGVANTLFMRRFRAVETHYQDKLLDEARFKRILADFAFDAVLLHDEGRILDCNHAFLELADLTAEETRALNLTAILPLSPESAEDLRRGGSVQAVLHGKTLSTSVEVRARSAILAGKPVVGLIVRDRSAEGMASRETHPGEIAELVARLPISQREKQIVTRIVDGYSRSRIAEELFISDETVKKHIKNIYLKLNLTSKVELIRLVLGA